MSDPVTLDADFIFKHTGDNGVGIALSMASHRTDALGQLFDAGWHRAIRAMPKEQQDRSRSFLLGLGMVQNEKSASWALGRFLEGASVAEANALLTAPCENDTPVVMNWFMLGWAQNKTLTALLQSSVAAGLDLESTFLCRTRFKARQHTILSVLVTNTTASVDITERSEQVVRAGQMLDCGKQVDKPTAISLFQECSPAHASVWIALFKKKGVLDPQALLNMTSKMKANPDVRAILQAEAAKGAMDATMASHPVNLTKAA